MERAFLIVLVIAYASTGVISFIAYLPTLKDLWKGHPSANMPSYVLWTACNLIALLYGLFILRDALFEIITGMQCIACAAILLLRVRLTKR